MTIDLIVRDGTNHTFGFSYEAKSVSDAVKQFKAACRRNGITKFKNIKIIETIKHDGRD